MRNGVLLASRRRRCGVSTTGSNSIAASGKRVSTGSTTICVRCKRRRRSVAARNETAAAVKEFVISRVFDAPRDLVWKAFTECEHLMHWWGPKGFKMVSCKMDFRPGGIFHYCLESPDGQKMWGKFIYREIKAPDYFEHT